jgi:RNA polymerase sigma-70 factor (ECF subfamily)
LILKKDLEYYYLKRLEKGYRNAFDVIFLHYYPRVKLYLFSFLKDEENSKDLSQEIFIKIWINRGTISNVNNMSAYLFRMAKNAIYNHFQHNLIKQKFLSTLQEVPVYEDFLEEYMFSDNLQEIIDVTITKMPKRRKQIFIMSRQEGMSNKEIAEKLNISKRTIENQLTLALAQLRKRLVDPKL